MVEDWLLDIVFFSCPERLNRRPCPLLALTPLTIRVFTTLQSDPRDLWPLRHLIIFGKFSDFWKIFRFLEDFQIFGRFSDFWRIFRFLEDFQIFGRQQQQQRQRTCDIWDTDYNSDNWEPEFMTIFVIWQLIVTLDSIRNSCDVF